MSQQIKKKFIEANAIDGSKLLLSSDEAIRSKNSSGVEVDLIKLDVTNKLQLLSAPYVGPLASDELAAKSYVDQKIADLVDSAPALLDTLNELAAAIADDPNFASTVTSQVGTVQTNLNNEITRATAAEAGLQSDIDAEETRALAAEGVLQSNIDAEEAAREAADLTFLTLDGLRPMEGDLNMMSVSVGTGIVLSHSVSDINGGLSKQLSVVFTSTYSGYILEGDSNGPTGSPPGYGDLTNSDTWLFSYPIGMTVPSATVTLWMVPTSGAPVRIGDLQIISDGSNAFQNFAFTPFGAASNVYSSIINVGSLEMMGNVDMANNSIVNAPSISAPSSMSLTASSANFNLSSSQIEMKNEDPTTTVGSYIGGYSLDTEAPQLVYEVYSQNTSNDSWIYLNLDENSGSLNANIDAGAYSSDGKMSTFFVDAQNGTAILATDPTVPGGASATFQVQSTGVNIQGNLTVQPGSTINLNSNVLGSVGDGSLASDAVNKGQLDAAISSVSSGGSAALAQEIADRIAADAAIQSELDATQAGAGLESSGSYSAPVGSNYLGSAVSLKDADSKLDAQVKVVADGLAQEILDRVADVNAEESRAMAAESALDGRLDILEGDATVVGSVAKAEADAKAYTDSEIAALVNGAPALLDTLNELAAAINDDANFAVTIANSIAGVQSNLTQEISDRIADVNAEESRAMGVEASLQSQITQEVSDRQADVNAEESRAMGVEASLQSQITQEISDRQADVTAEETRAMAAESALDARVVALEGVAVQFASEKFTLSAGDISNGYVTLGHVAVAGSMNAFVDRLAIFETDDYTLSTVSGVTRVTFVGSLVTAGQEKLSAGDVVRVKYAYEVL